MKRGNEPAEHTHIPPFPCNSYFVSHPRCCVCPPSARYISSEVAPWLLLACPAVQVWLIPTLLTPGGAPDPVWPRERISPLASVTGSGMGLSPRKFPREQRAEGEDFGAVLEAGLLQPSPVPTVGRKPHHGGQVKPFRGLQSLR